ncbi:MAG TPA: hypothetical protein VG897_07760, partial [Terriglobales bacterium]|nr:hypothetical protein [Terriglobales bacterium]
VSGTDLLLTDGTAGDTVDLKNEYSYYFWTGTGTYGYYNQIEKLVFGDGATMNLSGGAPYIGSAGGSVTGSTGNDVLIANGGTETLSGNGGADTFYAGSGADTLSGGTGNDTYIFYRGEGAAVANDSGGTNTLIFGTGIADDQLWFTQQSNDLLISVIGTSQSVLVKNWYATGTPPADAIYAGDGHYLQSAQVANLVSAMASYSPPSSGQTTLPSGYATALEPTIAANWH